MKSKLLIIGITIFLILTSTMTVFANTETTVTVQADKTEVKAGESFSVILKAMCPEGIGTLETHYSYDTEKLELKSEEVVNNNFFNLNLDNGEVMENGLISVMSTVNEGDIYKITFQVKEGVEANSTIKVNFEETVIGAWNIDAEYKIPAQEITVTVIDDTTDGGNEENPPVDDGNDNVNPPVDDGNDNVNPPVDDGNDNANPPVDDGNDNVNPPVDDGNDNVNPPTGDGNKTEQPTTQGTTVVVGGEKDNTTASTNIPKAGISSIIIIAIIALIGVMFVIYKKNKSYSDIK